MRSEQLNKRMVHAHEHAAQTKLLQMLDHSGNELVSAHAQIKKSEIRRSDDKINHVI